MEQRREKTLFLFADDSLERRRVVGTNIKLPTRGNGNFTFIAIGTIMNIMVIYVSDESVILKNWNRSQNTFPDK